MRESERSWMMPNSWLEPAGRMELPSTSMGKPRGEEDLGEDMKTLIRAITHWSVK